MDQTEAAMIAMNPFTRLEEEIDYCWKVINMNIIFNESKLRELVLHVAALSEADPRFGVTKLNNLLFYMDFGSYRLLGAPITGATYQHYPQGPVPKELKETRRMLLDGGDAELEYRPYFIGTQERIIPTRDATLDAFTEAELSIIRDVIDEFWPYSTRSISDCSREEWAWNVTSDLEDIPYYTAWVSSEPLTPEQVEKGLAIAESL